jgi:hypothetical protein
VDIALLPPSRHASIGTAILRDLMAEAAVAHKPVRIHVEKFNPALRLYERLGFAPIEDKGVYLFLEWAPRRVWWRLTRRSHAWRGPRMSNETWLSPPR